MARALDRRQLPIDRNPLWSIYGNLGKLPKLDGQALWSSWLSSFKTATGVDLSSPTALVASIADKIEETATNIPAIVSGIKSATNVDLSSPQALVTSLGSLIVGGGDGGGLIDPSRLPLIPLSSIGQVISSVLPSGAFSDLSSVIDDQSRWSFDDSKGGGAAKITANGLTSDLYSGDLIPVVGGQVLHIVGSVLYSGLAATGSPIEIGVTTYSDKLGKNMNGRAAVAAPTAPSGTLSDWQDLAGTFTVPDDVKSVRLRLTVASGATAGDVWFKGVDANKGDSLLPINYVADLPARLASLLDLNTWQGFLDQVKGGVGGTVSDLVNRLQHITPDGMFDAGKLTNVTGKAPVAILPDITRGMSSDVQAALDGIVSRFTNVQSSGASVPDAETAMSAVFTTLVQVAEQVQALQTTSVGRTSTGVIVTVRFADYSGGPLSSVDWNQTYIGGSSRAIVDSNGLCTWATVADASTFGIFQHAKKTLTDYQIASATVNSGPDQNGAANYLFVRMNDAKTSYVYARFYCDGFLSYKGEIGCVVNGVKTVWHSGIKMPLNTNNSLIAGDPADPYKFTIMSANTPVYSYTDSAHQSQMGANFRRWGFGGDVAVSGSNVYKPGDGVGVGMVDHQPPAVTGFNFRAHRASTSGVTLPPGQICPAGLFDTVDRISADMSWDGQAVTVTKAGTYMVSVRMKVGAWVDGTGGYATVFRDALDGNGLVLYGTGGWSACSINAGFGVNVTPNDAVQYTLMVYCEPGNRIAPGMNGSGWSGGKSCVGEATGSITYFEVGLLNPDNGS